MDLVGGEMGVDKGKPVHAFQIGVVLKTRLNTRDVIPNVVRTREREAGISTSVDKTQTELSGDMSVEDAVHEFDVAVNCVLRLDESPIPDRRLVHNSAMLEAQLPVAVVFEEHHPVRMPLTRTPED